MGMASMTHKNTVCPLLIALILLFFATVFSLFSYSVTRTIQVFISASSRYGRSTV